jgi:hypothetical protein
MAVVEAAAAVDHAAPPRHEEEEEEAPGTGAAAADAAGEREMRDLEDLLSKLNPMAEEFVPPSLTSPVAVAVGAGPGPGPLTPAPLSPAAYGFYPAANAGFAVASPAAHRGVVGFPAAVADAAHAGRGRVRIVLNWPPLLASISSISHVSC